MIDGTYPAQVIEGLLGMTGTGKEQVAVSLETTDADGNPTGERIAWYGTFTDNAYPYTVKTLRVMGWQGDDLSDLSSIAGTPVSIVVKTESYEDRSGATKTSQKVAFVNPPGGGAILKEQMTPDAAKAFAARMKAKVRAADVEAGKPKTNGAPPKSRKGALPPEPPPHGDEDRAGDDIPF